MIVSDLKSEQGLPWQSSGLDAMLPLQEAQIPSLVGELRSLTAHTHTHTHTQVAKNLGKERCLT